MQWIDPLPWHCKRQRGNVSRYLRPKPTNWAVVWEVIINGEEEECFLPFREKAFTLSGYNGHCFGGK